MSEGMRYIEDGLAPKPGNPKDSVGSLKYPLHWVSQLVMGWVGVAMMEGARKYGGHNYRAAGVRASVNYTAARHHIDAFWEGQDIDPDTKMAKLHHLAKGIAALTVLYDGILQENWIDDRPVRNPNLQGQIDAMNAATRAIVEMYPNSVEPFTQVKPNKCQVEAVLRRAYAGTRVTADPDAGKGEGWGLELKRYTRHTSNGIWVTTDTRGYNRRSRSQVNIPDRRMQPERRVWQQDGKL